MVSFRIAFRYLFSKKSHNAVNVISIISMLGVAVATTAIVCVLSVFNGFHDLAQARLSRFDPELKIEPVNGKIISGADSMANILTAVEGVSSAVPTLREQVMCMFGGAQLAAEMIGVPEEYAATSDVPQTVIDGGFLTGLTEIPVATLSVGVAMQLQAFPGSERLLGLYVPRRRGRINPANPMASFRADSLFVGGVYRVEDNDIDASTLFVPLDLARELLEYESNEASAIEISLMSGADAVEVARRLRNAAGPDYSVKNRLEQEAESYRMIAVEKWITFAMLAFILLIASFNVVSTLSMLIIEKRDNMRTLRSLGATTSSVRNIFMWEGWMITAFGGGIGCMAGAGLAWLQSRFGLIRLGGDPSRMSISVYPVRLDAADLLIVAMLVVAIGFAVGWLTSRLAVRDAEMRPISGV